MRIGKQDAPFTAISTSDAERIVVRGKDLCRDIIGETDFTSYFWLLVTGEAPTAKQKLFADAVLCAIAEHGLVPSNIAARMTFAAGPEAFQGAVAAGLLGCGSVVLGSAEACGFFLDKLIREAAESGAPVEEVAERNIRALRAEKKPIPGYGHPQHSGGDPRTEVLLKLAKDNALDGPHIRMLNTVHAVIPNVLGRSLPINVNGAIPAVMLDAGFPLNALKGISLLARTASLIAHLQEESNRSIGFIPSGEAP